MCRTKATPEEKKSHYFPGVGNLKGEKKEVLHQFPTVVEPMHAQYK